MVCWYTPQGLRASCLHVSVQAFRCLSFAAVREEFDLELRAGVRSCCSRMFAAPMVRLCSLSCQRFVGIRSGRARVARRMYFHVYSFHFVLFTKQSIIEN
jgi:hypothetical protein